jgi:hypothetical protein
VIMSAAGAMDSDQYRCLGAGGRVDARAFPGGRSVNTCRCSDLDLWHRGLRTAATVAVVTGVGMSRLLQPPIKVDDWSQANQARRVSGSADAHVE